MESRLKETNIDSQTLVNLENTKNENDLNLNEVNIPETRLNMWMSQSFYDSLFKPSRELTNPSTPEKSISDSACSTPRQISRPIVNPNQLS